MSNVIFNCRRRSPRLPGATAVLAALLLGLVGTPLLTRAEAIKQGIVVAPTAPSEVGSVTLAELVRAARSDPPAVLAALATLRRVEAEQHAAEGAYLPRLTADGTVGAQYDNRRVLPGEDERGRIKSTSWAAYARLDFDWAAVDVSRKHTVEAAAALSRAERSGVDASVRQATLAAVELYLRALFAGELVADAELTLTRRRQQQESIEELTKAGVRPQVDSVRARVELVSANWVFEMRRTDEKAAFAALAAAIGREPERGLRPVALVDDVFAGPVDVSEASALARQHRPELAQLRAQVNAYDAGARATDALRLPSAGLFASGQTSYYDVIRGDGIEGDQYGAAGGLYLRWQGGDATVLRRREVARARSEEGRRTLSALELSVRAEAVDAAYAVQRAQAQLEQANQVLEAAAATRGAQQERYEAGIASLLELLDAEALEQNARRARIEALRGHDLTRAHLLAVCGTLGDRLR